MSQLSSQITETQVSEQPVSPLNATNTAAIDLTVLLEPVKAELTLVEQWLESNLVDDSSFISDLLGQIFKSGGKRIRPALVLLSAKAALDGEKELGRLHIVLAVLTELIHTASLVHDDVIDQASLRRGTETVNRKWNDKLAVLIGDLLFAQASICLARLMNPPIVGIYGQVLGDLCSGEIKQMKQQFVLGVDWDGYIQKSVCKTASLFAAGCQSAAILNRSDSEREAALKSYGLNLGICFQIIDDLLDFTGQSKNLGKAAGADLAQGVITAPALFVLERQDQTGKRLHELIKTRAVTQAEGIAEAIEIIHTAGGVEATQKLAQEYGNRCHKALTALPDSTYRDSLAGITDFMLTRTS